VQHDNMNVSVIFCGPPHPFSTRWRCICFLEKYHILFLRSKMQHDNMNVIFGVSLYPCPRRQRRRGYHFFLEKSKYHNLNACFVFSCSLSRRQRRGNCRNLFGDKKRVQHDNMILFWFRCNPFRDVGAKVAVYINLY